MSAAARNSGPFDEKTLHLIQLGAAVLASTIGFPTVAAALSRVDEVIDPL